jgi:hypothetical protein
VWWAHPLLETERPCGSGAPKWLFGGDRPDEAGELASAGDDDLLLGFAAAGHPLPALVETLLAAPGALDGFSPEECSAGTRPTKAMNSSALRKRLKSPISLTSASAVSMSTPRRQRSLATSPRQGLARPSPGSPAGCTTAPVLRVLGVLMPSGLNKPFEGSRRRMRAGPRAGFAEPGLAMPGARCYVRSAPSCRKRRIIMRLQRRSRSDHDRQNRRRDERAGQARARMSADVAAQAATQTRIGASESSTRSGSSPRSRRCTRSR